MSIVEQAPDMFLISIDKMDMSKVDAKTQSELDKIMNKAREFYPYNWIPVPIDPRITQCQISQGSVTFSNQVKVIGTESKPKALQKMYKITIEATDDIVPWLLTSLLEQVWNLNDGISRVKFFSPSLIITEGVLINYSRSFSDSTNLNTINIAIQDNEQAEKDKKEESHEPKEAQEVEVDTSGMAVPNKPMFKTNGWGS